MNDLFMRFSRGYVEDIIDAYCNMYYSSSEVTRLSQFNNDFNFRYST